MGQFDILLCVSFVNAFSSPLNIVFKSKALLIQSMRRLSGLEVVSAVDIIVYGLESDGPCTMTG